MSDEETKPPESKEVDGITPNGINSFTSQSLGIAIVIKPELTQGDLEKWLTNFKERIDQPSLVDRLMLFRLAIEAGGIIIHTTDKVTPQNVASLNGTKANWYGNQMIRIYNRYQVISPN